ncbi:MAG: hypothetical protein KAS17_06505 [Victivallaceae bacterium]|nr:hypothetical protein [Victivallaceae bacterium]
MFKTKKFIVFFVVALMGIALCQAAESKKTSKPKKAVKTVKVSKPANSSMSSKPTNDPKDIESACKCSKKTMIELGFFSPIQYPCEDTIVTGFRFSSLYTYNKGMNGFDCGIICDSGLDGTTGMQMALSNRTAGVMKGISFGLVNMAETEMRGIQIAGLYNQAGSDSLDNAYSTSSGVQCAFINAADSIFSGMQLGAINISNIVFKGLQIGLINYSEHPSDVFDDFQTKDFKEQKKKRSCVQIGVLNFNPKGIFPITFLINF